jgi:hypothetical protein
MAATRDARGRFVAKLDDQVSKPAGEAADAVDKLGDSLKSAGAGGSMFARAGQAIQNIYAAVAEQIKKYADEIKAALKATVEFIIETASGKIALLGTYEAILGNAKAATDLADAIDGIARHLPIAASKVEDIAKQLALAGLRGAQLKSVLETLAQVGSVSEEAGNKLQSLIEKMAAAGKFDLSAKALKGTGLSIQDVFGALAKKLHKSIPEIEALMKAGKISFQDGVNALQEAAKTKFGPAIEKQLLPINVQFAKFKEDLENIVEDIDLTELLRGLQSILSLFDGTTVAGQAMREMVVGALSGLANILARAFPYLRAFLRGFLIGLLHVYIALKPVGQALAEVFGGNPDETWITIFRVLGQVLGYVIAVLVVIAAAFATVVGAIVGLVGWIVDLIGGLFSLGDAGHAAGTGLIDGLVGGIMGGASAVISAALNVAQGAIGAIKGALGIASPSKVMKGFGGYTAEGLAEGMAEATPIVRTSATGMADATVGGAAKGVQSGAAGASKSGGPQIGSLEINIHGATDKEGAKQGVLEALAQAFGPLQLEVGV